MRFYTVSDLRRKCIKRIPFFSSEYLESGTGQEHALQRNNNEFQNYSIAPPVNRQIGNVDVSTEVFGIKYDVPFGVAPVGLSGLVWPKAELLLSGEASKNRAPYVLSTVSTETVESVSKVSLGSDHLWFQLYVPKDKDVLVDLLDRVKASGVKVLVITLDIPTPSLRERARRVGLSVPIKFSLINILRAIARPKWSLYTVLRGLPKLRNIEKYSGTNIKFSANYAGNRMGGVLGWETCEQIIQLWEGPVVAKGILKAEDAERAINTGFNAIYVSNHGGRQFDGVVSPLKALKQIAPIVKSRVPIFYDGGVRTGLDIVKAISLGADFVFLGRPFLYGVGAMGAEGVSRCFEILKEDLINNMFQLGTRNLDEVKCLEFERE